MSFVACIVAAAPLRAEASHRSEMVSQLLFGEFARVVETTKDFVKLVTLYDNYEGWCQASQLTGVTEAATLLPVAGYSSREYAAVINNTAVPFSIATPVYATETVYQWDHYTITYVPGFLPVQAFSEQAVKQLALPYLNVPYLWGGRSSFGIDCSGFTQQVMKMMGVRLLRDASQQATQGEVVDFLQEAQCGNLAYFDNEEGRITHVGIMLNNAEIIHASGRVRIDKIDNQGIVNSDTGVRTHKLRVIKRMK
ncbi:Cell wall-associated hydrolase, NlpC family [Filimonas lacunae]|uniref:Cell wall-associated hydrolase, NlpC family n=1 Tax=Filimonas lacunae TaxID=477680 RepID=A0A173MCE8_9BACT|nr:C40 family peptidase [Filimonas lacunae]BAV05225.1 dipeptidyl peptidase VI [Filimonas lacunae]SIT22531.1 Cell wall-associated hydrolase, NlpC family [Filimonas lacunae]